MNMNEYFPIISAEAVRATMVELQNAQDDVYSAAQAREQAYQNKAVLIKQKTELEMAIKLTESEALMNTEFIGKDQFGTIDGQRIPLNNDTNRNTFRRMSSADERRKLAQITAELARIEVEFSQADGKWQAAIECAATVKARAALQSKLLGMIERSAS